MLCEEKLPHGFIMETKSWVRKIENLKYCMGFLIYLAVNCEGRNVGLVLFWSQDINLKTLSYSKHHFDAWLSYLNMNCKWRITTMYGHLDIGRRKEIWNLVKSILHYVNHPWLCFENFKEVISNVENNGGRVHSEWQLCDFLDVLDSCHFISLKPKGAYFTWSTLREGEPFIQEAF